MNQSLRDPLGFCDHQARQLHTLTAAKDEAFRLLPGLIDFDFLEKNNFQFKTSFVGVNGLSLAAVSTPACRINFGDRRESHFVFAFAGGADFKAERNKMRMESGASAIFFPPGPSSEVAGGNRSVVVVRLDDRRLESMLMTMLGPEGGGVPRLSASAEVSLHYEKFSFDRVLRMLFAQIDAFSAEPQFLTASGIDEAFYRTILLATHRQVFTQESPKRGTPVPRRQLDRVCQYIISGLGNRITLTDLERIGFMSRRTLHNAFYKAFGLSPMGWVREQRLLAAHRMLNHHGHYLKVTDVMHACGFFSGSRFSAQYAQRFGELPSATLKQRNRP